MQRFQSAELHLVYGGRKTVTIEKVNAGGQFIYNMCTLHFFEINNPSAMTALQGVKHGYGNNRHPLRRHIVASCCAIAGVAEFVALRH